MRIGFGYDVHALIEGKNLILGGIDVPHHRGLVGHSDADVLIHAVCDALLGAAAAGDIGLHFPDTDPRYRGISSLILLREVASVIERKGYDVANIDTTIVTESPKLSPYLDEMREKIAGALRTSPANISIKATTTEGLGFTGRREGIAAYAVCLLSRPSSRAGNGGVDDVRE